MSRARPSLIFRAVRGALLLGAVMPVHAAAEGWAPVVSKPGKLERALADLPSKPQPKPVAKRPVPAVAIPASPQKVAAPAAPAPASAPPPATSGDITTGSVESAATTRMLSPADSARLFSDDAAAQGAELTTGAVDSQGADLAHGYCVNIAGTAADARIALQKAKLADIEKEIAKRMAALDAKANELKAWVERREQFQKRANEALAKIYTQMEPDAAALQLASMDEETAASVLMKLEPQNSSAILNEMLPEKASRLVATISGAARMQRPGLPPAAAAAAAAAAARARGDVPQGPNQLGSNPNGGRS